MADEPDLGELIGNAISNAIDQAVSHHEHGFVTKWTAVIESVGDDGARGIWRLTSDGVTAWDNYGLLQYALTRQTQATLNREDENDAD